jgi:hypothetical protein
MILTCNLATRHRHTEFSLRLLLDQPPYWPRAEFVCSSLYTIIYGFAQYININIDQGLFSCCSWFTYLRHGAGYYMKSCHSESKSKSKVK